MSASIRILLVDDHYVVRMGLKAILTSDPKIVIAGEADDGAEALELFRRLKPDITLMDLRMPEISGIEATMRIRTEFPDARVVMLTTFDGDEDIHRAMQAGARGYLLKNIPGPEFLAALHRVHSGERYLPRAVAERLAERIPCSDLTIRELEVLKLVEKGLSNREIGDVLGVSENTTKTHLKSILGKLGVTDRTEAVTSALHRGILHLD